MSAPRVDVVIPFAGPTARLRELLERAARLPHVTVVDNQRRADRPDAPAGVHLVEAAATRSSYHARNAGARLGDAPWVLFLDADVDFDPALVAAYLEPEPDERTGVLAGAVHDAPGSGAAARYAHLTKAMEQPAQYALTANCMVRRAAFEQAGGFREVRSGGDADLWFRLRDLGWRLERREQAAVTHRGRATVRALLAQRARHGGGASWVEREHPGTFPQRSLPGAAKHAVVRAAAGARALARGDRDAALVGLLDGPALLAFELGRRFGQEDPSPSEGGRG